MGGLKGRLVEAGLEEVVERGPVGMADGPVGVEGEGDGPPGMDRGGGLDQVEPRESPPRGA